MADISWEDDVNEEVNNAIGIDDDGGNNDWEELADSDDEEEKKKKAEAAEKEKQQKKEQKAQKLILQQKNKTASTTITLEPSKELKGMFKDYAEKKSDFENAVEAFGGQGNIHIELLYPKTEQDFDDFAQLVSAKLKTLQNDRENFVKMMNKIIENSTEDISSEHMKLIQKNALNLVNKKQAKEKEEKMKSSKKRVNKTALNVDDPFDQKVVEESSVAFDDDDDFM